MDRMACVDLQAFPLQLLLKRHADWQSRPVVVVDHDIDPTDTNEVLWALCTRTEVTEDIDVVRKMWSTSRTCF